MLQYHFNWKTISVAAEMTVWNFYFQIFEKAVGKQETILFLNSALASRSPTMAVLIDQFSLPISGTVTRTCGVTLTLVAH